mgnify:FL=1
MTELFVLRWKKKEIKFVNGKREQVSVEDSFSFQCTTQSVSAVAMQHAESLSHSGNVLPDTFELVYPDGEVIRVILPGRTNLGVAS